MRNSTWDVLVVGGGQAGLGISYYLNHFGLRHVVLERAKIGESWRTQRWDSFVLNSPNWLNLLPGDTDKGSRPDEFDSGKSFVSYLEGYAARWQLPVQEHARVVAIEGNSLRYHVTASIHGTTEKFACRQVVVASGAMNVPKVPSFARALSSDIRQYHAGEYRTPSELPNGAVLVVGSAQSGLQVAEEIIEAGRRVYLSTSAVGRVPRRYRGRDILDWLLKVGFLDVRTEDISDPGIFDLKQPQVSGVGPLGHTISFQSLARKGATVIGKVESVTGNVVNLRPNAADHVRYADELSGRIKALIERFIAENRLDIPPHQPDPADEPDKNAACASPIRSLDLKKEDIRSIIWATGFTGDFGYLKGHPRDADGRPVHRNGISDSTGLYFLGFPWLRKRKSGIINGIAEDAQFIAERVRYTLER